MTSLHRRALLLRLASLPLAGAGRARAGSSKPRRIALVMKSLGNEFFQAMQQGAQAHQREHASDYVLTTTGIRDETDIAGQVALVRSTIAERPDAIVIAPADSRDLVPALEEAIDHGIIVINIDNKLDDAWLRRAGLVVPFVGPDNRKGAKIVGNHLAKFLVPGAPVAIIEGISSAFNARQRTAGFEDAMKSLGAEIVAVRTGLWETDRAEVAADALLREHPGLKALLCGNDSMALGAVAAVQRASRNGQVYVVGYDNIPAIRPLLADGRVLATADQFGARQAVYGIETALKGLAEHRTQRELPAVVETQVVLVTR